MCGRWGVGGMGCGGMEGVGDGYGEDGVGGGWVWGEGVCGSVLTVLALGSLLRQQSAPQLAQHGDQSESKPNNPELRRTGTICSPWSPNLGMARTVPAQSCRQGGRAGGGHVDLHY